MIPVRMKSTPVSGILRSVYLALPLAVLLGPISASRLIAQETRQNRAKPIDAAFAPDLTVDGDPADWAPLISDTLSMDTQGRGENGTLAVDIQYAWNYTHLYILVRENPSRITATTNNLPNLFAQEAPDASSYQDQPWNFDSIAFWIDTDNNAGTLEAGSVVVENNADFQPWFGFSSSDRTDLMFARVNNSDVKDLNGLLNATVATGGSFANRDRVIEIALNWEDIAYTVEWDRQPNDDLLGAIAPGLTLGCEPLLVCNDFNAQAFIGPDPWSPGSGRDEHSRDIRLISGAPVVEAAFAPLLSIDGDPGDWSLLPSATLSMDTQGRGTKGTMAVDIQYAWDYTNLYLLIVENTNRITATTNNFPNLVAQEAPDAAAYQDHPWSVDSIAFWLDLGNNAGTLENGEIVVENNADFQPWFGFSSNQRTDLMYARANDSGTMNLEGLYSAVVATGGAFANRDRVIEVALNWEDITYAVDWSRQPNEDLLTAINPGFAFGSEPLLICNDFDAQAFIGPDPWNPGSGMDHHSRDVRLVSGAPVVDAAYASNLTIDGDSADWSTLPSGLVSLDTQGRGANGTMAVDIRYAWDWTHLYILVRENTNSITATTNNFPNLFAQEAPDSAAYQDHPWSVDSIGFWIDCDNNAGTLEDAAIVVENNADFQPWFGFSSSQQTDLIYARVNNSDILNLDGFNHALVATGGSFANRDRVIEVALKWDDIAATVEPGRQPAGDLVAVVRAGFTFGSEPLLICNDFNAQAFIGPDQWNPGSGMDQYSRDIRLIDTAQPAPVPNPTLEIALDEAGLTISWPATANGFALETTASLANNPQWSPVPEPPTLTNGRYHLTVQPGAAAAFYRLHQ
jgi:hypothetical protein